MADLGGPFSGFGAEDVGDGIDVEQLEAGRTTDEPQKPRRGRPPKGEPKPEPKAEPTKTPKASAQAVSGIESLLLSIHTMLAAALGMPELALTKDEANQVAKALAQVQRHYSFEASEKAVDIANLEIVLSSVYGPRIIAAYLKDKRGSGNRGQPATGQQASQVVKFASWPSTSG
jgi:hypothetical protein